MKKRLLIAMAACCCACAKPVGTLMIVNIGTEALTGTANDTAFTVRPGKAWSLATTPVGEQTVTVGDAALHVTITEGMTTVVEPSGTGCFVVADFQRQYGGTPSPEVVIDERFERKKTFTLQHPLLVAFGRKLPTRIPEGTAARRLHSVDCELLRDKNRLSESLARLP
ncbi:MAG: hypothetical protein HYV02_07685 [Deltaproteobacteria bacterium]|nr:hypothetical protein [Deltaproteobacteria bacterium]